MSRRQERMLARQLNNQPRPIDNVMVPANNPPVLTHGERSVVQVAARACRAIENTFNETVRSALAKLSAQKPRIVTQRVLACEQVTVHANAQTDLYLADREIKSRGQHLHHQRRISRRVRILLLVALGLIDVLAYRSAVEVVFGTSDDLAGKVESLVLALLSIGMIVMAAASGDRIRHWLDAKAEEEAGDNDPLAVRAARRELTLGIVFAGLTVLALWAGARLRLRSMEIDGNAVSAPISAATMVFSALAALGAFVIELRWASELLDKRDRLVEAERKSRQRMDQQHHVCARLMADHQAGLAHVTTLWDEYQPLLSSQIHACLERMHHARKIQPRIFHPLSADVDELVKPMIEADTSLIDPVAEIERLELRTEDIDRAVETEMKSRLDTRAGVPIDASSATAPDELAEMPNDVVGDARTGATLDLRSTGGASGAAIADGDAATRNAPSTPSPGTVVDLEGRTAPWPAPANLIGPTNAIQALNGQPVDGRS